MEWKNPPGHSRGLITEAAELRRNPGRWGMIAYTSKDQGRKHRERILNGKAAAFRPQGAFEADLRYTEDGYKLYIRYIGEEGEHATAGTVNWTGEGPAGGPADPEPDGRPGMDLPGAVPADRAGHL